MEYILLSHAQWRLLLLIGEQLWKTDTYLTFEIISIIYLTLDITMVIVITGH